MIEGEYKKVPTGSYWRDVVTTIPNGAKDVQITHKSSLSTLAGMLLFVTKNLVPGK